MRKYLLIGLLFTVLHSISQPGGSLVPGFGSFGVAASTTHSLYEKVVVQPDGKVVVISVHPQFFSNGGAIREIIRFNTDGTRDMNFGVSGSIILQPWYQLSDGSFRQLHLDVEDIAIQPDGKIVATARLGFLDFLQRMELLMFLSAMKVIIRISRLRPLVFYGLIFSDLCCTLIR